MGLIESEISDIYNIANYKNYVNKYLKIKFLSTFIDGDDIQTLHSPIHQNS